MLDPGQVRPVWAKKAFPSPPSQNLVDQVAHSYLKGFLSRNLTRIAYEHIWVFSINQCCIPLDSTTFLYLRLKVNHNFITWALYHFRLAVLWLCQSWDFNIVLLLEQIHTWANDLEIASLIRIYPWIHKSLYLIHLKCIWCIALLIPTRLRYDT
jgi:hypothetical protein